MQILPNPLRTHKTFEDKKRAYMQDVVSSKGNAVAYASNGKPIPLRDVPVENIEFIGGLWRVQNPTEYTISHIRDLDLIMGDKLPRQENTFFEYYKAMRPTFNCYGIITIGDKFNMVVAKYTTDTGTHWGYGYNIEEARAFLGIRLYDMYKDWIHNVVCKNIQQK